MAWLERPRVAVERDLALVLGLQEVGPVLGRIGDDRVVRRERHDAVVVAVPDAVGRLGRRRGSCPRSRPCTARRGPCSSSPNAKPTSTTSGACGPGLSLLALIASISSPEPPAGSSSLTAMPYLVLKRLDDLAVVAPVMGQGDGRQVALGLGRGDELGQVGRGRAGGRCRTRGGCRRRLRCRRRGRGGRRGAARLLQAATSEAENGDEGQWTSERVFRHQCGYSNLVIAVFTQSPAAPRLRDPTPPTAVATVLDGAETWPGPITRWSAFQRRGHGASRV